MDWWQRIAGTVIAGNELWRIAALFVSLLAGLVAGRFAQAAQVRSALLLESRRRELAAVTLRALARAVPMAGFTLGLKIGFAFLRIGEGAAGMAAVAISALISVVLGFAAYSLVDVVDHWLARMTSREVGSLGEMVRPMVRSSLRVTIVILVLLQIAQLLTDKPLTSILAGLGVGGLAIALAAQDTVKNFFGSLVIFADKPFLVGERVVVDNLDGVVEQVGFRSTRLRTLDGHLVTIPNGELANKAIQNIGRRPFLRRVLNLSIPYATPPAKVERAIAILNELLANHEGLNPERPPRVVFNELTATALNILVIYWYHPPDFWLFQAFNQRFNLQLIERFNAEGIEFAFPTQTVHVVQPKAV